MTDELEQRITQLEREVRQLRAKEGAIAAFNKYLYGIDTGFIPDILDAFSENASLDVINFPPDGVDMHFESQTTTSCSVTHTLYSVTVMRFTYK